MCLCYTHTCCTLIHTIDFGFSSSVRVNGEDKKLNGLIGTMEYAAPEIFDSKVDTKDTGIDTSRGYSLGADMWSVGILMHLVLAGELPVNVSNKQDLDELKQGIYVYTARVHR